jgi:predicted ATPase
MVIATYRSEEASQDRPLYRYLPTFQQNRAVETIHLKPLDLADTHQLVEGYLGPASPELASYVQQRTEGHPLFSVELLNDLREQNLLTKDRDARWLPPSHDIPVPRLLKQIILQRVARLGVQVETLLMTAAVVGETWTLPIVEALIDLRETVLFDALERAVQAQIIRVVDEHSETYRFAHGLIYKVLYNQLIARKRKRLHEQIASVLETHSPSDVTALAHHYYEGEIWDRAYQYLLDAGDDARRRFASYSALQFYRRAHTAAQNSRDQLDKRTYIELFERLARVHLTLEQREEAELAYAQMRDAAQAAQNRVAEGRAMSGLAVARFKLYQFDRAEKTAFEALDLAEQLQINGC